LKGEAIPLVARIFAIADVFDALCSRRPYKAPFPLENALEILQCEAGMHFDPRLIQAFTAMAEGVYSATFNASETETRALMEAMVHKHFGL
jgi:HD-GYP domain-containing protein (c-di-GMP phosphodiesterase class II)